MTTESSSLLDKPYHRYGREEDFVPVNLALKELSYYIDDAEILHNINCYFQPGQLVAIMGPTGSGKTSLLNVIAGRHRGNVLGKVIVNGQEADPSQLRSGFKTVPEEDILFSALTPRETLQYAAELRLPEKMSAWQKKERVDRVLASNNLSQVADVPIGSADPDEKGIALSERRRTNIGVEMLTQPQVLCLHEPTSGLDPQQAEELLVLLKEYAETDQRIVICTVNHLSYSSFLLFNWLVLISEGEVAYSGPVSLPGGSEADPSGKRRVDCLQYFASLGYYCPHDTNPADWLLATIEEGDPESSFPQLWAQNPLAKDMPGAAAAARGVLGASAEDGAAADDVLEQWFGDGKVYATNMVTQFVVLLRRCFYVGLKDPSQLGARLRTTAIVAVLMALAYVKISDSQVDWQDRCSVLFLATFFNLTNGLMTTVTTFPSEAVICYIENYNGSYRLLPFYIARLFSLLVFQVAYGITFALLLYYIVGLDDSWESFSTFTSCCILLGAIGTTLGVCIGLALPTMKFMQTVLPPVLFPLQVFAGYLVRPDNIPDYFYWIYKISFYQFGYEILCSNEFEDLEFDECVCDDEDRSEVGGCPDCPFGEGTLSGEAVLDDVLDFDSDHISWRFLQLLLYLVLMVICGYIVMRQKALSY